jgi:hypothetical protein
LISYVEAHRLVRKTSKYMHAVTVSAMMGKVAEKLGR